MRRAVILLCGLIFLLSTCLSNAYANNDQTSLELGLNDAVNMAIKKSVSLKSAELIVDRSYEQRKHASDQVDFAPVIPIMGTYNPSFEAAWYNLLSADLSWQMSKRSQSMEEDRLVIDTCDKYWRIFKAKENVEVSKLSLKKAEQDLNRIQVMNRVGMSLQGLSPQLALLQAQIAVEASRASLAAAENQLTSAYESFNQQLGLNANARPALKDYIEYHPVNIGDIDNHVVRVLDGSPSLWMAEERINIARYAQQLTAAKGQYTPYEIRKIEVQEAELASISARDAVRLMTRELYYGVRDLEEAYTVRDETITSAKEALRVNQLMYELGMATSNDVLQKELDLANAEQALLELIVQHNYLKMALQKPWAVTPQG